jgi:Zn finger protein HypA/HybF involved in hydrogenase expression
MDEHRLDGNAAAGALGEIFSFEMTSAQTACASCGALWRVGQTMVYAHELGTIVRCANCDNAMIRVAQNPRGYFLDLRGVSYLQVESAP